MNRSPQPGIALRVYLDETDRGDQQPLYERLVLKARELGLRGATVLRGSMGYGSRHVLHTEKILRLSTDLPVVVEIVDQPERIHAALLEIEALAPAQLIVLIPVELRLPQSNA